MGLSGNSIAKSTNSFYAQLEDPMTAANAAQMNSTQQQQELYDLQAKMQLQDAQNEATQVSREASQYREEQANKYSMSGVLLEGSPMLVLEHTRNLARQSVDAIMARGSALAALTVRQGGIQANESRAQLLNQKIKFNTDKAQSQIAANSAIQSPLLAMAGALSNSLTSYGASAIRKQPKSSGVSFPAPSTNLGYIHGALPLPKQGNP